MIENLLFSAFRLNFLRKELVSVPEFFVALLRKNALLVSPVLFLFIAHTLCDRQDVQNGREVFCRQNGVRNGIIKLNFDL